MKMMGLKTSANFVAWFFSMLVSMVVVIILFVVVLKFGKLLPYSDPVLIFVFLLIFSISTLMLRLVRSSFYL